MAGRFLLRKLSSRMSRSTSLLGAYASACAAAGEPVTRRALTARYFRTLPCTRAASETGCPANGVPSAITLNLKPAFLNFVGVKRFFSSSPSTSNTISLKPKVPTSRRAELEAQYAVDKAALDPDFTALSAKIDRELAWSGRYLSIYLFGWFYIMWCLSSMADTSSGSHCCSTCCKCQSTGRNPKIE